MTTDTTITAELLDQLLANYEKPEDLTGAEGLFKQLKKALIERALGAELSDHLGYEKGTRPAAAAAIAATGPARRHPDRGRRDRHSCATRPGRQLRAAIDRQGQRRFDGFDDKILSLYARGMTVREIQGIYPNFMGPRSRRIYQPGDRRGSRRSREWQTRPLDRSIQWCFSTRCGSRFAMKHGQKQGRLCRAGAQSGRREGVLACGLSRPKAPSSGSKSSTT